MGDRGESPPLKADKYLCERGNREQGSQQHSPAQINTFFFFLPLRLLRAPVSVDICRLNYIILDLFLSAYSKDMFSQG